MMIVPILMVRDIREAVKFYTFVLDFNTEYVSPDPVPFYAVLTRGGDELHLNLAHEKAGSGNSSAIVVCDDVDALFTSFTARGLLAPAKANSPAHQGPLDQTWGTREVYIDDPSGNTIVFQQR